MGVFGVMAKLGPFCSRDNCSLVRGVLDRLITYLLVWSVHVWLRLEGGSPGAGLESVVLLEGVGAMDVAGTVVGLEDVVEVLDILEGTFHTFMVSTHVCPKHTPYTPNTPTPNLQEVLQQHHLGKFLTFYLLG